jgi:glycogen debranching enzyme
MRNQIPHPLEILHGGGAIMTCDLNGQMKADSLHGLFAGDTRVLSTYRITLNGSDWRLLTRYRSGRSSAQWKMQNPRVHDLSGEIPESTLFLSVRRKLDGVLSDELDFESFSSSGILARLTIQMDADFSDIFEVKERRLRPRLNVRRKTRADGFTLEYQSDGFQRATHVRIDSPDLAPSYFGSLMIFPLSLPPRGRFQIRIEITPEVDGERLPFFSHTPQAFDQRLLIDTDPILQKPFEQGVLDLHALAIAQKDAPPYVAAGAPWFLTLFGRDPLTVALMSGLEGAWSAHGALSALKPLQAKWRDDWRDAEPGKLPHENRTGELARRGLIPHNPYYGTHDAPALFCLTLWHAWRWTGDPELIPEFLPAALSALQWCDELGDRDQDGLLEYETRSRKGYYNQSWKDAEDAILDRDGNVAKLPLATIEMQGYLFAARLAISELLERTGDHAQAEKLRASAFELRQLVESRFWQDSQNFYAVALDGQKKPVMSICSNPGHLLWCGLSSSARAASLADRLLQPDLFSGWGLRTLSSHNPGYNPLLYQRGSVWPHDTLICAAGLMRYGHFEPAFRLIRAILEAAGSFEETRLPELFCGFERGEDPPVPYEKANSPQAWAAASPILAAQLFLGLLPDAARNRCYLRPQLPDWLPRLEIKNIRIGEKWLSIRILRSGKETLVDWLDAGGLEIFENSVAAPLWGAPFLRND